MGKELSSIEKVHARAQAALAESPFHEMHHLRVDQADGSIRISGRAASFYHKQLAQELVRSFCPGAEIVNAICVDDDPEE